MKELKIYANVERLTLTSKPDKSNTTFRLTFNEFSFIDALPHITRIADFCKETWPEIEFTAKVIRSLAENCEIEMGFTSDGDLFRNLPPINSIVKFCQDQAREISGVKADPPPAAVQEIPPAPAQSGQGETEKKGKGLEEGLPSKRPMHVAAYSSLLSKYSISIEQGAFLREQTCDIQDIYRVFKEKYPESIKTMEDVEGFYRGVLLRRGLLATQDGGVWETSEIKANGTPQGDAQGAPPGPSGDRQNDGQGITPPQAREGHGTKGGRIGRGDKVRVRISDRIRFEEQEGARPPRVGKIYSGTVWNVRGNEILVGLPQGKVWVREEDITLVEPAVKEV